VSADADIANLPEAPEVFQLDVGMIDNLCEIVYCPETKDAAVVDPAFEPDRLLKAAAKLDVRVNTVLITHTHNDHIEAVDAICAAGATRVYVHPLERQRVEHVCRNLAVQPEFIEVYDRMDIAIGNRGVRVLETFGHTIGGVCYLADGFIISNDILFVGGCGRTDLKGGNTEALWHSLQRLMALPEEIRVYPGHDYGKTKTSTIGREILENPYLRCDNFEAFRKMRERR